MAATTTAKKQYQKANTQSILSLLTPIQLLQRSHGIFAALHLQIPIYLLDQPALTQPILAQLQPQVILTDPLGLQKLYQNLPSYLGDPAITSKAFEKAQTIINKREEAIAQGKKDPALNRMRYRLNNQKLYNKVQAKLGGKIQYFWLDSGPIAEETKHFFEECALKLIQ
ncbi:MAG TPA: hypothetical protein ENJ82_15215 [Bacteroidetes bacterium]|nr:hypothetical protein [Bacteroidota bacterium]